MSAADTTASGERPWVMRTTVALLITLGSGVVIGLAVGGFQQGRTASEGPAAEVVAADDATPEPIPDEVATEGADQEPAEDAEQPRLTPIAPPGPLADVAVALEEVASFEAPTAVATRSGDDAVYVAERAGRVRVLRGGQVEPVPLLDLSGEVSTADEQGLLGLAFHPGGDFLYVNYTDLEGDNHLHEFAVTEGGVDVASRREVLAIDQPGGHHNSSALAFGPDGYLYVGSGDGDSAGDPSDNGQDPTTLLGAVLRIDPRGGEPYAVPPDNPFVGSDAGADEVYVSGVRNPWKLSFDRATGDLWIGDVGHDHREEITLLPAGRIAGANLGWNRLEGRRPFQHQPPPPSGTRWPLYEYSHGEGCAVTGGFVYRGAAIPALQGAYVFGDFCYGWVRGLTQEGGAVTAERDLGLYVPGLVSFGEDAAGELYALSSNGPLLRLVPAPAAPAPTPIPTPGG